MFRLVIFAWVILFSQSIRAEVFQSSDQGATLIELYTSEGCSSCPPADRWLSSLKKRPALFKTLFPVAFHVDYWNQLGWPDRFSSTRYTERQQTLNQQGLVSQVYTPGLVVNGQEWRGWLSGQRHWQPSPVNHGQLQLIRNDSKLTAHIENIHLRRPQLHLVYLGMGLTTRVSQGENRGRRLDHDFVVLEYTVYPGQSNSWNMVLPPVPRRQQKQTALVAWISDGQDLKPLQIAGGWLDSSHSISAKHDAP